jgi:hypothetical protein
MEATSNNNNNMQNDIFDFAGNSGNINPIINMQDLMNVRESYNKRMLEESDYSDERKYGLIMMMGGGTNIPNSTNIDQIE